MDGSQSIYFLWYHEAENHDIIKFLLSQFLKWSKPQVAVMEK